MAKRTKAQRSASAKKVFSLGKETQLQKKVPKVKRNVRTYFPFFKLTFDTNYKVKLIKKGRSQTELF